jgi:hypothetical protein
MPKRQIRINLSDAQWLVVAKQQELGGYRSIANTIEAEVIIYQESFTAHLSAPYLPQPASQQPRIAAKQPLSITNQPQHDPNNPNGF